MHIDWRAALTFVSRQPAWTLRVGIGGAFMLLLPPLGWVLALGYRSLVANRLLDDRAPLLPEWPVHAAAALRRGLASSGIILTYLTPALAGYWLAGVRDVSTLSQHWRELAVFAGAVIVFPPLCIPGLPVLYAWRYDWLQFSAAEVVALLTLGLGTILLLPAAFLQVARHRRFSAAFRVGSAVKLIAASPRLYLEAWIVSLAASAIAVLLLPLAPWLLFYSYLAISHVFLQVLDQFPSLPIPSRRLSANRHYAASITR